MSQFSGRNGFAVGLTLGLCLALLVYLFFGSGTKIPEEGQISGGFLWNWTGPLVSSADTLAQWIMAILTIFAVVLLWQTLVQTNKTNQSAIAAAHAATEANFLLRQDQRPWLSFEVVDFGEFQVGTGAALSCPEVRITNLGKSPALRVHFKLSVIEAGNFDDQIETTRIVKEYANNNNSFNAGVVIFPGAEYVWSNTLAGGPFKRTQEGVPSREISVNQWWLTCVLFYEFAGEKFHTRQVFSCSPPEYASQTRGLTIEPMHRKDLDVFL
jgi:hypothetical protein